MSGQRVGRMLVALGFMGLIGCAANGKLVTLDVGTGAGSTGSSDGPKAAVVAFEDARAAKGPIIGVRYGRWGNTKTEFTVPGGQPEAVVAKALTDTLKRQGWRAAVDGADVMFTGKVLAFTVEAESKVFRTNITAKTKMVVEGHNVEDGSVVRMTVDGEGAQQVFWFEPEDARDILAAVLTESLEKFVHETKVEKNLLRLK